MAAQTWDSIKQAVVVALMQAPSPYTSLPPDFEVMFPQAMSYAEGRIYRDLTPLCARTQNTSLTTTSGQRTVDLSTMTPLPVLVIEGVSLVMPAGELPRDGVRYSYQITSLDWIDMTWPNDSLTMAPDDAEYIGRYWAMLDEQTVVLAPTPDDAYIIEVTGLFMPTPISASNQSTYLSQTYPELLMTAGMVFLSGWLDRNYGAQASDPQMAQSHEAQYQALLPAAIAQENRMRGAGTGWTPFNPTPLAQPPRT